MSSQEAVHEPWGPMQSGFYKGMVSVSTIEVMLECGCHLYVNVDHIPPFSRTGGRMLDPCKLHKIKMEAE